MYTRLPTVLYFRELLLTTTLFFHLTNLFILLSYFDIIIHLHYIFTLPLIKFTLTALFSFAFWRLKHAATYPARAYDICCCFGCIIVIKFATSFYRGIRISSLMSSELHDFCDQRKKPGLTENKFESCILPGEAHWKNFADMHPTTITFLFKHLVVQFPWILNWQMHLKAVEEKNSVTICRFLNS